MLLVRHYVRKVVGLSSRLLVMSVGLVFGSMLSLRVIPTFLQDPRRVFWKKSRPSPPSVTLDKRYGEHGFAKVGDVKLHYVAKGRKGAPLVLLVHGFPECWWSWRHQLTALGEKYYTVAFDMRGYCESSKPSDISSYHVKNLIADVHGLINHLGYDKCILIGHDWGGVLSWHFTIRYPTLVDKLVVLCCPHPAVFRKSMSSFGQILKWAHMFYLQLPWLPEFIFSHNDYVLFEDMYRGAKHGIPDRKLITDDDIEMYKYAFSQPGALTGSMNYYRAQFSTESLANLLLPQIDAAKSKSSSSSSNRPQKIQQKTLILWGGRDVVLPPNLAGASQKYCENSQVRFFDNASHWLQQHEPADVNREILQFLSD